MSRLPKDAVKHPGRVALGYLVASVLSFLLNFVLPNDGRDVFAIYAFGFLLASICWGIYAALKLPDPNEDYGDDGRW